MTAPALRHLVLLRFKPDTRADQIAALMTSFAGLARDIPGIAQLEYGINDSPENLNQGLTHIVQMHFDSAAARAVYLPHPAHLAVVQQLQPLVDEVLVFDYLPGS